MNIIPITELGIKSFVKISYAHEHTAENYTYTLQTPDFPAAQEGAATGVLEIGMVKLNPIIFKDKDGRCYRANEGDIFIIPPNSRYEISTAEKGLHKHITTEAIIGYSCNGQAEFIALPLIIPKGKHSERISEAIKKIVSKSAALHITNYFDECSDYMKLLARIKEYTEKDMDRASPPSSVRYCTLAEKYALENIGRHVMVEEIAEHIGISKNYLTNIFSKYKGMPITEYINRMKLNHMLELMLRFGYNASKAGEYVGLDNVNYISRMFKKYYGVTIREYKQLHF